MATRRAIVNDENSIYRADAQVGGIKKATTTTTVTTRRAALGDLANRTDRARGLIDVKKVANHHGATENVQAPIDFKNVKPRVDTHWANQPVRKPLSRGDSTKKPLATGATASTHAVPKLVKTKSIETTTVKEVKLIKRAESLEKQSTVKRQETTNGLLRRKVSTTTTNSTITSNIRTSVQSNGSSGKIAEKKSVLVRSKSNELKATAQESSTIAANTGYIAEPPVIESRFPSYSNGLIRDFEQIKIDEGDENNPLLVSEYVNDIYSYLFAMERKYAIRSDHLKEQAEVFPRMRTVLLDWINEVHLQYRFVQETFHITALIIDRYLQSVKNTTRKNLQLVGVAALFIASKFEELYPPEIRDFVYITDNTYTKEEILRMEKHILKKLKFELGAPTSIHFLRRFSKAAQCDGLTHIIAKYFLEASCIDYKLSEYLPSEIAAASLFVSLCIIDTAVVGDSNVDFASLWTPVLEYYSTYTLNHLNPIIKNLIDYVLAAPTSKTNNVYKKYSSIKLNEAAKITEKSEPVLRQILQLEFEY